MLARESGDWSGTAECSHKLGLSESEVAEVFWQAMQSARQVRAHSYGLAEKALGILNSGGQKYRYLCVKLGLVRTCAALKGAVA